MDILKEKDLPSVKSNPTQTSDIRFKIPYVRPNQLKVFHGNFYPPLNQSALEVDFVDITFL